MADSGNEEPNEAALENAIRQLMNDGDCTVVESRNDRVYRLRVTKNGRKHDKAATIDEINKAIANGLALPGGKRVYRSQEDLDDPNAEPKAEVNLLTKKLTPRVSREHVDLFDKCANGFQNKRQALERAIELLARDCDVSNDLPG